MISLKDAYYAPGKITTMGITYKSGLVDSFVVDPESTVIVFKGGLSIVSPKKHAVKTHNIEDIAGIMICYAAESWVEIENDLQKLKELISNAAH